MSTSRAFAYNTGSPIPGTEQIGNLAVVIDPSSQVDYFSGGLSWVNGPDEDNAHVLARPVSSFRSRTDGQGSAGLAFWTCEKTEQGFLDAANYFFQQNFAEAKDAKAWMTANGYWTSWADTWNFSNGTNLLWPTNSGYNLYSGGFNNPDDGYSNSAISSIDFFEMNGQGPSKSIYVSTNGYITLGSGSGSIIGTPQSLSNPAAICGNPGDNWMQPGLTMTDGDVQNVYYLTGGVPGKSYIKFLVYGGTYGATTLPTSWLLNFYRDSQYQWVETRVKDTIRGNAGPYNSLDVSQQASTNSRVWRGNLIGQEWVYMGTGSVI